MIIFETERFIVRSYNFDVDKEDFFRIHGDAEVMRYIRPPKSREESDKFLKENIEFTLQNPGRGRVAVTEKESGKTAGSFALIPVEGTQDWQLGYVLLKEYWGKGVATELTREGLKYFFSTCDLEIIYGVTEEGNLASQKVLLKNGFKISGHKMDGQIRLIIFQVRRADLPD
ncbi:MAG TPA: GNAT family N-acetyltransferase [Chitinophagaceae bacterium]|nr:GNAT family N-acetyltransferase [Chitinophagaceae bacterium]